VDNTQNEKLAQLQQLWYERVYVPAFISTFNEKAAAVNLPPIQDQATLDQALQLAQYAQNVKAAHAKQSNPITNAFNKLSSVNGNQVNAGYAQIVDGFSKAATEDKAFMSDLKSLFA